MRLEVSEYATLQLEEIWSFHAVEAGVKVADKITGKILSDIDRLVARPRAAQVETLLDHLGMEHRRLVSGHYKIIYRIIDDLIFVSDIFDSRQDPERMAW